MCIALVIPKGVRVDEELIERCSRYNQHGCGFAYVGADGKVVRKRWADSEFNKGLQHLMLAYSFALEKGASEHAMLMHFRYATAGPACKDNSHPFYVSDGAMVHNGHLFTPSSADKGKSDTRVFAEKYKDALNKAFVDANATELERTVGNYNKIAFLWNGGDVSVLNRDKWTTDPVTSVMFSTTPPASKPHDSRINVRALETADMS